MTEKQAEQWLSSKVASDLSAAVSVYGMELLEEHLSDNRA